MKQINCYWMLSNLYVLAVNIELNLSISSGLYVPITVWSS